MSEVVSTSVIRSQALADTGFAGDDFAGTTAEINQRILRSARDVHWEVIRCVGEEGYLAVHTFTTQANLVAYPLPSDFEQLREALAPASRSTTAYLRLEALEAGGLAAIYSSTTPGVDWPPYTLTTSTGATPVQQFEFVQQPPVGRRVAISYVRGPVFVAAGAEFNLLLPPGGLEYLVNDLASSLMQREQNDASPFEARKAKALDTVKRMAVMQGGPARRVPTSAGYYARLAYQAPGTRR